MVSTRSNARSSWPSDDTITSTARERSDGVRLQAMQASVDVREAGETKEYVKRRRTTSEAPPATPTATNDDHESRKQSKSTTEPVVVAARRRNRPISEDVFGLIQEELSDDLYALLVQAILWNQTTGRQARPVLHHILSRWPTPHDLARADLAELTAAILPIGLHNVRARRLISFAEKWEAAPPCAGRKYLRRGYPDKHSGKQTKKRKKKGNSAKLRSEIDSQQTASSETGSMGVTADPAAAVATMEFSEESALAFKGEASEPTFSVSSALAIREDEEEEEIIAAADELEDDQNEDRSDAFEVAHLPGIGAYALDSYRMFHRDRLRGVESTAEEPEWKRVVPADKELRAWLVWRWAKEGLAYDVHTGRVTPQSSSTGVNNLRATGADGLTFVSTLQM